MLFEVYSKIVSAASCFPENFYTNDRLISEYNITSTSEWIEQMTGIKGRYFVQNDSEFNEICIKVAKKAVILLDDKNLHIDAIIVATSSNFYKFPGISQIIHFNMPEFVSEKTRTLDINAACNGFMQALAIADDLIKTNQANNIIVLGADAMSSMLDMKDRSTCCLFGDGAGAVVLQKADHGITSWAHLTFSEHCFSLTSKEFLLMNGRVVFEYSTKVFKNIILEVLQKAKKQISDIDLFILHQANYRIFQNLSKALQINEEKIPFLASNFGNISAGTIPAVLAQVDIQNKTLVIAGFGAGFTASANVISCY